MQKTTIDYIQWRNRLEEFTSFAMRIGTDVIFKDSAQRACLYNKLSRVSFADVP